MTALLVIGILVLVFVLIGLLRVGAEASYSEAAGFTLAVRAGFLSLRLGGKKEKNPKKKKAKKPKKPKKEKEPEEKPRRKLPPLPLILSLAEHGFELLLRLVSRLRVELLRLHVTAALPDPADAAMLYGAVGTAMDGLLRAGRGNLVASDLRADVDFDRSEPLVDLRLRVTIRIGQIVGAALRFGFGFLKDLLRYKRSENHG